MKFYIASSAKPISVARVKAAAKLVELSHHTITFEWWGPQGEIRSNWQGESARRGRRLAEIERDAVKAADVLLLVAPPVGRGLGCYIETGIALGKQTPIWIVGQPRESVFWRLPEVRQAISLVELDRWLREDYATMPQD